MQIKISIYMNDFYVILETFRMSGKLAYAQPPLKTIF